MHGIVLILVMVVTGGAIAFIGDKLGTKIGKKRLSIFGLRPRHTSMIITVLTGIFITGLSIGTLAVVSEDVRTALFGMEELNAAIASTKTALDTTTKELQTMQEEYNRADAELDNARDEISNLKTEQQELAEESERLKAGNERLEVEKNQLLSQNENLSSTNENLTKANSELESKNNELNNSNATLTTDNEKLSKDKAELEEHTKNLRDGLIAIREGDIVFRAGEVLASAVMKGGQPAAKISENINKLADAASENIAERFGEDVGDTSIWIYQPDVQKAVENISGSKKDMIVRITAAGNLVRGEPIRTSLSLYPNESIYDANEFILSHEYEVKSSDDAETIVREFLAEVNHSAVDKGILPDPITGSVGVIDGDQLYYLIDKISNSRGKITLTARAREAVNSFGPLRLNIEIISKNKGSKSK